MIEYKELLRSEERAKKGREILNKILPDLQEKYPSDYYVYIEVDSGDYFVGESMEAYRRARAKYPNSIFYGMRLSGPDRLPFIRQRF
jgi:hypothetical protein